MRVIREAAGDDTYLLASTGPTLHTVGVCDAVRTGSDFGEGRALFPGTNFYPATYVINARGFLGRTTEGSHQPGRHLVHAPEALYQ